MIRDIVRGLYDGRYVPGQRLVEAQLAAHYGLSRGPIREALNSLAATGVVELMPQRGARIRIHTVSEALAILIVAQRLMGLAAYLSAKRIGQPGVAARLRAAMERLEAQQGPADAVARDVFYGALVASADNEELSRVLQTVQIHLIRTQLSHVMDDVDRERLADYRLIFDAVCAGLPEVAEAATRSRIERSIRALIELEGSQS